jgi:hypothetical protein
MVVAAGVIWYQQAQGPEAEDDEGDEAPPDRNGLSTVPPHTP